jgi:hypothetical protein
LGLGGPELDAVKVGPDTVLALTACSPRARIWFGDRGVAEGFGVEVVVVVDVRVRAVLVVVVVGAFGLAADAVFGAGGGVATVGCVVLLLLVVPHPPATRTSRNTATIGGVARRVCGDVRFWLVTIGCSVGCPHGNLSGRALRWWRSAVRARTSALDGRNRAPRPRLPAEGCARPGPGAQLLAVGSPIGSHLPPPTRRRLG